MNMKGLITFSTQAGKLIRLEKGSQLEFCRDEDKPNSWYLHIAKSGKGFKVWQNTRSKMFSVNSAGMVREIFSDTDTLETKMTFMINNYPIELNGEKFWRIITDEGIKTGIQ